jgi:hypothetical protein
VANFTLLVFLALRNTPLAPLSGNSYETLRPLHKVAGYTCILTSVIHGISYTVVFSQKGELYKYKKTTNFSGAIAGVAMLIIGLSTIGWFVQKSYEGDNQLATGITEQYLTLFQSSTSFTLLCLR